MSNLGLVFLLQLVRIVEIHDDTVHGQRLNCAGVERVHHAPDDVINITGRQVLSQRLQRGGGERRRVRIARTHFCDVVLRLSLSPYTFFILQGEERKIPYR